ncbi:MAG: amidase [Pigmentiphaga sp.]
MQPYELSAAQAARLIASKKLSCEELARSCLARIDEREALIRAWSFIDRDQVLRNARELDKNPPRGRLHGLPVGVKDVINTFDMPTGHNSPIYIGHRVGKDAACIAVARSQGAQILGKTETAEFAAAGRKAPTCNARHPAHTPGGSSSGSAAAVGDRMVPLAFGTQTGGSLIRPAAYNGIYALKPTHGAVSNEGAKMYSPTLDTIGWYGRSVDDLALVAQAFRLLPAPMPPRADLKGVRIGLCRGPNEADLEDSGEAALMAAATLLSEAGAVVETLSLPEPFNTLTLTHRYIMRGEGRVSMLDIYLQYPHQLHEELRLLVENVPGVDMATLIAARDAAAQRRCDFDALFDQGLDLVLTPPAPGEAPHGLASDGPMTFNAMWTALHVPCVALPVGLGRAGLPVGIQLVARRGADASLLQLARLCAEAIGPAQAIRERRLFPAGNE